MARGAFWQFVFELAKQHSVHDEFQNPPFPRCNSGHSKQHNIPQKRPAHSLRGIEVFISFFSKIRLGSSTKKKKSSPYPDGCSSETFVIHQHLVLLLVTSSDGFSAEVLNSSSKSSSEQFINGTRNFINIFPKIFE
jgi:hypothetical protein